MSSNQAFGKPITDNIRIMQDVKVALLHLKQSPDDTDVAGTIPCATQAIQELDDFHGSNHIIAFAYIFEGVLSRVRDAELRLEEILVALLLSCCDHLSSMLSQIDTKDEINIGHFKRSLGLLGQLHKHKNAGVIVQLELDRLTRQFRRGNLEI